MNLFGNFPNRESLQKSLVHRTGNMTIEIAMFQPDQAGNAGAAARLAACLGLRLHLIEPCGFPVDDQRMRRAGMDYLDLAAIQRHPDWATFRRWCAQEMLPRRLVLLSTRASHRYDHFAFQDNDILILGSESRGVPQDVRDEIGMQVRIPVQRGARSLNVVVAAGMVAGYAAARTGIFDLIEQERET
jgi:tRNA (cytidine/uridine-2'-O-)-methyltransferase